jgi:hypothetical protein
MNYSTVFVIIEQSDMLNFCTARCLMLVSDGMDMELTIMARRGTRFILHVYLRTVSCSKIHFLLLQ